MATASSSPAGRPAKDAGFTLVELLVVLVLIGLVTMAAPAIISAGRPALTAQAEARALLRELKMVREAAVLQGRTMHLTFDRHGRGYIGVDGQLRPPGSGIVFEVIPGSRTGSNDADRISFFPDGSASGGIIRVSSGGNSRLVSVHWLSGRASVDD